MVELSLPRRRAEGWGGGLSRKSKEVESADERAKPVHGDANGKTRNSHHPIFSPEEGPTPETLLAVVSRSQTACVTV